MSRELMLLYMLIFAEPTNAEAAPGLCKSHDFGVVPHPDDCSRFVVCTHSGAIVQSCADNMLFDATVLTCNYAHSTRCERRRYNRYADDVSALSSGDARQGREHAPHTDRYFYGDDRMDVVYNSDEKSARPTLDFESPRYYDYELHHHHHDVDDDNRDRYHHDYYYDEYQPISEHETKHRHQTHSGHQTRQDDGQHQHLKHVQDDDHHQNSRSRQTQNTRDFKNIPSYRDDESPRRRGQYDDDFVNLSHTRKPQRKESKQVVDDNDYQQDRKPRVYEAFKAFHPSDDGRNDVYDIHDDQMFHYVHSDTSDPDIFSQIRGPLEEFSFDFDPVSQYSSGIRT